MVEWAPDQPPVATSGSATAESDERRRAALVESLPPVSDDTPVLAELHQDTRRRIELLRAVLRDLGVEDQRLRLEWISASQGEKVQRVCNEMTEELRKLGPLRLERPQHQATEPAGEAR